ncbi:MAG: phosphoribosylamine--glycine ligase [Spirochaetes bacterium]|nr:phosphoribosylamine--glycine ligase [Spirochaetota bacterium]
MKYLIIGSGGREHALYWRLLHDKSADEVFVAPGNGGVPDKYRVNIKQEDFKSISGFCTDKNIDIVVVGPEAPLVAGIVDHLKNEKIPAFGPVQKAAMLEGSKLFAKTIMNKYNIPTAGYNEFSNKNDLMDFINSRQEFPIVIKLDGLAAGKGVGIPESKKEALDFIKDNVTENAKVFVEDFLEGEEASVLGISDGETVVPLTAAQDHKRIFDGDKGPNTGGMGAYAPAPVMNSESMKRVQAEILTPTIRAMREEGIIFKGVLYAGLMLKGDQIKVLEFNARFGDPEVQVILPLLNGRLGDIIEKSINGNLNAGDITFSGKSAITVVMSSGGYPGPYEKGKEITGLDSLSDEIIAFHAGTELKGGKTFTNGGRVLNITAMGNSLIEAKNKVYNEIEKIKFDGVFYRKDIGNKALKFLE